MNSLKTLLYATVLFSGFTLICMDDQKNNDKLQQQFRHKKTSNRGSIPEPLLGQWIKNHNQAMDWVAQQRKELGIKNSEPLTKYKRSTEEGE